MNRMNIWFVDNERYRTELESFSDKIDSQHIVLKGDKNENELHNYNLVLFLLNPEYIGNIYFTKEIQNMLEKRRSGKTILFLVNDSHELGEDEKVHLKTELQTILSDYIEDPFIRFCSTFYASIYWKYCDGKITLEQLQKQKNLRLPDEDDEGGYFISGRQIAEKHIETILKLSGFIELLEQFRQYQKDINGQGVDVSKKNILVTGYSNSGKTSIIEVIQGLVGHKYSLIECGFTDEINDKLYDKNIIVLEIDNEHNLKALEEYCSNHYLGDKLVIINKIDNYMLSNRERKVVEQVFSKKLKLIVTNPVCFTSAYYMKKVLELEEGSIELLNICNDNNIVLEDSLGFPLNKDRNKKWLKQLLREASGLDELMIKLEE